MKVSFSALLLSLASLLGQPDTPDGIQLIEQSIAAERENQIASANWLAREDIRHYAVVGRKKKRVGWQTFEASFLEGRPYYRNIAINGKPLTQRQTEREDARMEKELQYRKNTPRKEQVFNDRRIGFGLRPTLMSHDFKVVREEMKQGRRTWVVEGKLRPDTPPPSTRSDGGLSSNFIAWIDQETKLAVREELTVQREWMHLEPGSTIVLGFDFSSGLRLVSRIVLRGAPSPNGHSWETEQIYSEYKKFAAESQIILDQNP